MMKTQIQTMPTETNPTLRDANLGEEACIPSIEQLRARQIRIKPELYKQLVIHKEIQENHK